MLKCRLCPKAYITAKPTKNPNFEMNSHSYRSNEHIVNNDNILNRINGTSMFYFMVWKMTPICYDRYRFNSPAPITDRRTVNSSKLRDQTIFSLRSPFPIVRLILHSSSTNWTFRKISIWFHGKKYQTVRPHRSHVIANVKNKRTNRGMMSRFHFLISWSEHEHEHK